jgi:hypothetical protein
LQDFISLGENASETLLWELNYILGGEVLVNILGGANAILSGLPT